MFLGNRICVLNYEPSRIRKSNNACLVITSFNLQHGCPCLENCFKPTNKVTFSAVQGSKFHNLFNILIHTNDSLICGALLV